MAETNIEWAHYTFNPWRGCQKISPGCANCYAETFSHRNPATLGEWGPNVVRAMAAESYWKLPFKWNEEARKAGERRRVFCSSLADVFEDRRELEEPRLRLYDVISQTKNLDWLLLTKRPENISKFILWDNKPNHKGTSAHVDYWSNVWLGTSVENQETADKRIPELLKIPAKVRFLSCEPLLGPVDLNQSSTIDIINPSGVRSYTRPLMHEMVKDAKNTEGYSTGAGIDWVICGGESGPHARPMHPDWARSIRNQCINADIPFLFKQWGEWCPISQMSEELVESCFKPAPLRDPEATRKCLVDVCVMHEDGSIYDELEKDAFLQGTTPMSMFKIGKKKANRVLDGRTWDEYPETK